VGQTAEVLPAWVGLVGAVVLLALSVRPVGAWVVARLRRLGVLPGRGESASCCGECGDASACEHEGTDGAGGVRGEEEPIACCGGS